MVVVSGGLVCVGVVLCGDGGCVVLCGGGFIEGI